MTTHISRFGKKLGAETVSPFKLLLIDGRDWVVVVPAFGRPFAGPNVTVEPRKAFKEYHGRMPSRGARLFIVPPSYALGEGGMTISMDRAEFSPVEVL